MDDENEDEGLYPRWRVEELGRKYGGHDQYTLDEDLDPRRGEEQIAANE